MDLQEKWAWVAFSVDDSILDYLYYGIGVVELLTNTKEVTIMNKKANFLINRLFLFILVVLFFIVQGSTKEERQWHKQESNVEGNWFSVHFVDDNTGWIAGQTWILNTVNRGETWIVTETPEEESITFNSIFFFDKDNGWAVGSDTYVAPEGPSNSRMLYTEDGGATWKEQEVEGHSLKSIYFPKADTGWVVGRPGLILYTEDGGKIWEQQESETDSRFYSLYFTDTQTGWVVGSDGVILHTKNGGQTWDKQESGIEHQNLLTNVHFTDAETGWISGTDGILLHTHDSGKSWTKIDIGTNQHLRSLYFLNKEEGWVVGDRGTIMHTSDGGQTWNMQESGTENDLSFIHAVDSHLAWAVGYWGTILHYDKNAVSIEKEFGELPNEVLLKQNYPNPFNPSTQIRFVLLEQTEVSIEVYDLLGRRVDVLFEGVKQPGDHSVTFDASELPGGLYVYQLKTSRKTLTRKMMLIK